MSKKSEATTTATEPESSGLIIIPKSEFTGLSVKLDPRVAEINAGTEESFSMGDVPKVRLPTRDGKKFTIENPATGDEETRELEGLLVFMFQQSVLWATEEPDGSENPPVLICNGTATGVQSPGVEIPSDLADGIMAAKCGETDDGRVIVTWDRLPFAQWGSSGKGRGKRVADRRVLFILQKTAHTPVVLTIPAGSIRKWKAYYNARPAGTAYIQDVISFTIETEKGPAGDFPTVRPRLVSQLSLDEALSIKPLFYGPLSKALTENSIVVPPQEAPAA